MLDCAVYPYVPYIRPLPIPAPPSATAATHPHHHHLPHGGTNPPSFSRPRRQPHCPAATAWARQVRVPARAAPFVHATRAAKPAPTPVRLWTAGYHAQPERAPFTLNIKLLPPGVFVAYCLSIILKAKLLNARVCCVFLIPHIRSPAFPPSPP